MRRFLVFALVLIAAPASAQVVPQTIWPQGVTPIVFGAPASAVNGGGSVNASLIPTTDNTFDLGSASFRWKDLWLGGAINWSDACIQRGGANQIDVCSGDSLNIVSGSLITTTVAATSSLNLNSGGGFGMAIANASGAVSTTVNATGVNVQTLASTATNDDPTERVSQYRATTTDGVATAAATFTIATSTSTLIKCAVVARRTGGAAGAAEDSAMYDVAVGVKNTAGTVAEIAGETLTVIGESQAGWTVTAAASGATEIISVTGATDNNVTWHLTCRTYGVNQ